MKCLKSFMEVGTWETKALGGEAYWFQKEVLEMPLGPCARSPPPPPPRALGTQTPGEQSPSSRPRRWNFHLLTEGSPAALTPSQGN